MSPRVGGPVNAVRQRRAKMFSAKIGERSLGLAHETSARQRANKVVRIITELQELLHEKSDGVNLHIRYTIAVLLPTLLTSSDVGLSSRSARSM